MNLHNFAFLYPLQTLDEFNSGHFFDSQSSIETIWLILSQLDVDSIQENELEKISSFWCESVITAKIYIFTKKPKISSNLFLSYCLIPQVAFSLYQRLLKKSKDTQNADLKNHLYDPIMAVFGFLENIFDEIETPSNYPIKFSPIFDDINPVVEFFREHADLPRYNLIISWGLRFLFSSTFYQNGSVNEADMQNFNEIKDLIDPNGEFFFDTKAELEKQTNTNSENNQNDNDNANNQTIFDRFVKTKDEIPLISILFIRYSLTTLFNIQITSPITAPNENFYENFYNNVIFNVYNTESKDENKNDNGNQTLSEQERIKLNEKVINLSQTFLYVSGNKTLLPPKLFASNFIPGEFITLSFLSNTIDEAQIDIYKTFEKEPISRNTVLFIFNKLKTQEEIDKFIEYLNSHQFTDGWINEARACMLKYKPMDRLINDSLTGDSIAAKTLLDYPECKESLTPDNSILHKILFILLSNDPQPLPKEYPRISKPKPANSNENSSTNTNTNAQSDSNAKSNENANTNTNTNPQPDSNANSNENSNTNANTTSQSDSNANSNENSNKNTDTASQTDSNATPNSNENSNTNSNSDDVKIPFVTNVDAAIIYKAIQHNYKLDFKPLILALHELLIDEIDSITKKRSLTYLVLAGFKPQSNTDNTRFAIPHDAKDLIVDYSKDQLSMIFLNAYMILLYHQITHKDENFDEESLILISDFVNNYYFSPYLKTIAQKYLPHSFVNISSKHQSKYIENSLQDKELRPQILDLILPTIQTHCTQEIVDLAKFFINDGDIKSYLIILSASLPFAREIISVCPLDVQESMFDDLIEKGDQDKIKLIGPILLDANPALFKKLGIIAMKTPKLLDSLLNVCNCSNESFIEAISSFSGEITTDFAQMLKKLVHSLPIYTIKQQCKEGNNEMKRMNIKWDDEKDEISKTPIDPWNFDEDKINQIKEHNKGKYPCFFCYTCGIFGERSPICLNCALKCHRGHDIAYYNLTETPCACGKNSNCKCKIDNPIKNEKKEETHQQQNTQKQATTTTTTIAKTEGNKKVEKYFDANNQHNTTLLIQLFKSLINSKIMKPPDPLEINRLTTASILDVDITKFHSSIVSPRLKFASVQSNDSTGTNADSNSQSLPISLLPKLIDPQSIINEIQNQSTTYERHFEYRTSAFPISAAAVGGPLCNILVVASGRTLTSFNIETMQQLSTYRMSNPGFQISFCPLDPSVFAVASLKHVMIFSITDDGSFHESEQIMLLLEELSPTIFVNSVVWVPLECLHLAVVCNMFIKIYDIPTDRFSPIACFMSDSPNFFSSAVFVEHEEECYGLFAMSTGRIAIQNTNVDPSDGPIPLTRFAVFPRFSNHQLTLSYSQDSDILFISSPPQPLVAMRLEEFFKNENPQFLSINLPSTISSLHMYFVHCINASLHFMVNPFSGSIFTIEFIDNDQVEVASFNQNLAFIGFPLYDRTMQTLSTFVMQDKLYAIGKNGKILSLQSADDSNDDDDDIDIDKENEDDFDEDEEEGNNDDDKFLSSHSQFIVPASFWTETKIAPKFLIEISAPNISSDPSILLSGGGFMFPGEIRHKYIDISIKDENSLIVGFIFSVGVSNTSQRNRPSFFKIFNRRYNTICPNSSSRGICIPLRKEEVRARRRYRIQVGNNAMNNGNNVFIDSLDVFILNADKINPKYSWMRQSKEFDWFKDGEDVFDFSDSRQILKRSKEIIINETNDKNSSILRNPRIFKEKIKLGGDVLSYMINNLSLAFPLEFDVDNETLSNLIKIMYSNPEISIAARRMVIKSAKLFSKDSKRKMEVLKIWADTICDLAKSNSINDKQWGLLWRDVALMPPDLKELITPVVWKSKPQLTGTFTALTAFLTK